MINRSRNWKGVGWDQIVNNFLCCNIEFRFDSIGIRELLADFDTES